ncbi:hypothetical protein QTU67_003444 [Vibrio cholerae]|nr:hypothetical protein [Vibrio cholerae]ELP8149153.1 hypothetical protein [Vibrio cholerae]ELW1709122.1 hypothetical protein [Vibrio cholerae]
MSVSQKNTNSVDLYSDLVDLDELLRFLSGAASDDQEQDLGLFVALRLARGISSRLRSNVEQVIEKSASDHS